MAISILDSDRIYRYELEVFINHMDFTVQGKNAKKSRTKNDEESVKISKYTIKITLDDLLETDISNNDKVKESSEDQLLNYYDDLKENNSLYDITKQLDDRYHVDESPVCNLSALCYNISQKEDGRSFSTTKLAMGKGVVYIFACMPRILITILQKNPLKLAVFEDTEDGQNVFGEVFIALNSLTGFTNAIAYHFYEKGYGKHVHAVEGVHAATDGAGEKTNVELSVAVRLTCHGSEGRVDRLALRPDVRPRQLQPVYADPNTLGIAFDGRPIRPRQEMTYLDHVDDADLDEPLRWCRRVQESTISNTCFSPCSVLLRNIRRILTDDEKEQYAAACKSIKNSVNDDVKTAPQTICTQQTAPDHCSEAKHSQQ
ncbi:uncharacterized protein LOC112690544 [Sipha flava]|uniref:Uncharacterized protein LOC112690544 n=1 Tax=Sipha flava TaxID=143950 RepID=A0A8B8GCB8_9HEMI|nr:uncharacterized protein LOC112690544 [Sipha flava]